MADNPNSQQPYQSFPPQHYQQPYSQPYQQPYQQQPYQQQPYQQQPYQQPYSQPYSQPYQPQQQPYQPQPQPQPQQQPYQPQPQPQPQQQSYQQTYSQPPRSQSSAPPPQTPPSYNEATLDHSLLVDETANQQAKYRDLPWLLLFFLHIIGVCVIFGVSLSQVLDEDDVESWALPNANDTSEIMDWVIVFLASFCMSCLMGSFLIRLMITHTRQFITVSIISMICLMIGYGVAMIASGFFFGLVFIILGVFWALIFRSWKNRIPFAVLVLHTVAQLVKEYTATIWTAFFMLFIEAIYLGIWIGAVVLVAAAYSGTTETLLVLFLIFSLYWSIQVFKNIVHVSVCGLFATWFFQQSNMPSDPTKKAFKRATTTSFGSICLGSLLVALIQTIRSILKSLQGDNLLGCFIQCILNFIEWVLEYFNHYAFAQVAIYGKSFCESAKSTYALFQRTHLLNVINDSIIGSVLSLSCYSSALIVGLVSAGLGALIVDPKYWLTIGLVGALIALVVVTLIVQVVDSGVVSLYVCIAEDPNALRTSNLELYNRFVDVWPEIENFGA